MTCLDAVKAVIAVKGSDNDSNGVLASSAVPFTGLLILLLPPLSQYPQVASSPSIDA